MVHQGHLATRLQSFEQLNQFLLSYVQLVELFLSLIGRILAIMLMNCFLFSHSVGLKSPTPQWHMFLIR